MPDPRFPRPSAGPLLFLLLTLLPGAVACAAQVEPAVDPLSQLAVSGRFDQLSSALGGYDAKDPRVASLQEQVQRHQRFTLEHSRRQRADHDKAMGLLRERLAQGKLDNALLHALEAQSYSEKPLEMLELPELRDLTAQAVEAARKAEIAGDPIESLNLYRALNLLYEQSAEHLPALKAAERRVRLLRMYAPRELERMIRERAKKQAKKDEPEFQLGEETWQQTLEGVERRMLVESLAAAAERHVDHAGHGPLLRGGIEGVLALLEMPQLAATPGFESLGQPDKVAACREALKGLSQTVKRSQILGARDAARVVDQVVAVACRQTLTLPEAVVVYEMADGAMAQLDDFSAVIWPREAAQFNRNVEGQFYGVGIQISMRDGRLVVVSPLAGSPAFNAGVRAGDVIASVNQKPTDGWTLDRAVREITGPENTQVTLGIERKGLPEHLQRTLRRAAIKIESIQGWEHTRDGGWDFLIDPAQRIAYVRMSQFIPQTADDLDNAISQVTQTGGLNALILDLRFNPGGLLSAAVQVGQRFVPKGTVVSIVAANRQVVRALPTDARRNYPQFPVVVLVNQGSASASEIVAGALKDHRRAWVVGSRSFGKGSVQDLFELGRTEARLKLTTQYYMLPGGDIIHRKPGAPRWGIDPHLDVPTPTHLLTEGFEMRQAVDVLRQADEGEDPAKPQPRAADILAKGLDPQLESALILLRAQLLARQVAAK